MAGEAAAAKVVGTGIRSWLEHMGVRGAAKAGGKLLSRSIPYVGWGFLAWDAYSLIEAARGGSDEEKAAEDYKVKQTAEIEKAGKERLGYLRQRDQEDKQLQGAAVMSGALDESAAAYGEFADTEAANAQQHLQNEEALSRMPPAPTSNDLAAMQSAQMGTLHWTQLLI